MYVPVYFVCILHVGLYESMKLNVSHFVDVYKVCCIYFRVCRSNSPESRKSEILDVKLQEMQHKSYYLMKIIYCAHNYLTLD